MAISNKKAVDAAKVLVEFCKEQPGCQNCIFRRFGADRCLLYTSDAADE